MLHFLRDALTEDLGQPEINRILNGVIGNTSMLRRLIEGLAIQEPEVSDADVIPLERPVLRRQNAVDNIPTAEPYNFPSPPMTESSIASLPCGHVFHASCIFRWIGQGHNNCPMCRGKDIGVTFVQSPGESDPCPICLENFESHPGQ